MPTIPAMQNEHENEPELNDLPTLEPPGSITIIGGGPLGIEAALYGRFLGYQVTLLEADQLVRSLRGRESDPIPMSPDRCASPLAKNALMAQSSGGAPASGPVTIGDWIEQVWLPLAQTDLLRGRVHEQTTVSRIEQVEVSDEETGEALPPDFRVLCNISSQDTAGQDTASELDFSDTEAVIVATGRTENAIELAFDLPQDYFFVIGNSLGEQTAGGEGSDAELEFWTGLKEIVAVYASLGGRADLDLYRPTRG